MQVNYEEDSSAGRWEKSLGQDVPGRNPKGFQNL